MTRSQKQKAQRRYKPCNVKVLKLIVKSLFEQLDFNAYQFITCLTTTENVFHIIRNVSYTTHAYS